MTQIRQVLARLFSAGEEPADTDGPAEAEGKLGKPMERN